MPGRTASVPCPADRLLLWSQNACGHQVTGLLEDASSKCNDIRHHDFDANRLLMAMLLGAVCDGGDDA